MDPTRYISNAKAATEVVREMAAIPAQQVVIRPRILLYEIRDHSRYVFGSERGITKEDCLSEIVVWVALGHHTCNTWLCITVREAETPLKVVHMHAHVEGTAEFQERVLASKDMVHLRDRIVVRHIVYMKTDSQAWPDLLLTLKVIVHL